MFTHSPRIFLAATFAVAFMSAAMPGRAANAAATVEQWDVFDLALPGPADGNPYVDVSLSATFTDGRRTLEVPGFYDGEGMYHVHFMPAAAGTWHYETHSNRWALTGKTGNVEVSPPAGTNHGPVSVARTYHFAYADGSVYRPFGTTIYNWIYRAPALQEQTIKTLADSPFNKVRMLVLPTEGSARPPVVPFPLAGEPPGHWDFGRFNPAFFRLLEQRIRDLRAIGVEADVILFHPYGKSWGMDGMSAEQDDRYVRYVVARLAAYRNVWWSMANEYDFLRTKTEADWDRVFQVVQRADPYGHLRSIHNGFRLYDNSKPWVTHASIQNGLAVEDAGRAEMYRDVWQKPVVYDEVKYEGDIARRWGHLTGEELVHRFWSGTVAGTYVGHGETFHGPGGTAWLSAGGTLVGASPARIAFLRKILEDGPAEGIEPIDKWQDPTIGGKAGEFYLVYFGHEAPSSWSFHLPRAGVRPGQAYRVEVIDPWAMTITAIDGTFVVKKADAYTFVDANGRAVPLPGKPQLALRIRRVGGPAAEPLDDKPVEP